VIEVCTDDLAFIAADAIARPVDAELRATTPLMRRLEIAGGDALAKHLRVNEPLAVGSAVVTPAGALGVELLIHGVVSSDTEAVSPSSVRRALSSALQRAADWGIDHLAIAPFGIGAGNLGIEESADAAADSIRRHRVTAKAPTTITIVVETAFEQEVFERVMLGVPT
jgi:O-acetyl-ADP-ribose deacetylase (regulator of RNase III)